MSNSAMQLQILLSDLRESLRVLKAAMASGGTAPNGERINDLADQILAADPSNVEAVLAKAFMLCIAPPHDSAAAEALICSLPLTQLSDSQVFEAGEIMCLADAPMHAARCFRELINRCPNSYEAMWSLASLQGERDANVNSDEAIAILNKAIQLQPSRYEAYNIKGNLLWDQGHRSEAIQQYESALMRVVPEQTALRRSMEEAIVTRRQMSK